MSEEKKPTRYIIITIVLVALVAAAITRPWQYLTGLPFLGSNAALTVNTTSGKAEVYLDGKKMGDTPFSSENLPPGEHTLEIRRISNQARFYTTVKKNIHLEANTRTFVEAEIGPSEQFSSVKLIYYNKTNSDKASIFVKAKPANSKVVIDDISYGETPVATESLDPGRHTLEVSHDGYEEIEASVIIREGYTLIAEIELMALPVELQENK